MDAWIGCCITCSFEYRLKLLNAGTFFYHSHIPLQYIDGLFGALIVDPVPIGGLDPVQSMYFYDEERTIVLNEWFHTTGRELEAAAIHAPLTLWKIHSPRSVLINGRGRCDCSDASAFNGCNDAMELTVINVKPGHRYRLRIISAGTRVGLSLHIEKHNLLVVQAQGESIEPLYGMQQLEMQIGERYDVLLDSNQLPDNYWIMSQIIGCTGCTDNSTVNDTPSYGLRAFAVLHYEGAPEPASLLAQSRTPFDIRPFNAVPLDSAATLRYNDARLKLLVPNPPPESTNRWVLNTTRGATESIWYINGLQFQHATVPVLLDVMRGTEFAHESLIWTVRFGEVLDIVLYSANNLDHPMHLHGNKFFVLGWGNGYPTQQVLQSSLNTHNPMIADTAHCPGRGWLAIRMIADRPGPWMYHCV
jgi:FtsP/CotA-like multicopper oxidase with cupredoxin domain